MGITHNAPPIVRFLSWLGHQKSLCEYCRKEPKRDGDRYCSDLCGVSDGEMQAFG